jgi:hypothetical protein
MCVQDSFVRSKDGTIIDNTILKEDRTWANLQGIFLHPTVTVNNITYRGDLNGYDIFRAVCAGFSDSPAVCKADNVFEVISQIEDQ